MTYKLIPYFLISWMWLIAVLAWTPMILWQFSHGHYYFGIVASAFLYPLALAAFAYCWAEGRQEFRGA